MNSRQRRTARRYWRHEFVLSEDITFEKYKEIRCWCEQNLGKIGYRWGVDGMTYDFGFRHERDYLLFLLRCA